MHYIKKKLTALFISHKPCNVYMQILLFLIIYSKNKTHTHILTLYHTY